VIRLVVLLIVGFKYIGFSICVLCFGGAAIGVGLIFASML